MLLLLTVLRDPCWLVGLGQCMFWAHGLSRMNDFDWIFMTASRTCSAEGAEAPLRRQGAPKWHISVDFCWEHVFEPREWRIWLPPDISGWRPFRISKWFAKLPNGPSSQDQTQINQPTQWVQMWPSKVSTFQWRQRKLKSSRFESVRFRLSTVSCHCNLWYAQKISWV